MREIKHLSVNEWLRSAIPDSQPTSPIGFLFLKVPPPPCAVPLVWILMFKQQLPFVWVRLNLWKWRFPSRALAGAKANSVICILQPQISAQLSAGSQIIRLSDHEYLSYCTHPTRDGLSRLFEPKATGSCFGVATWFFFPRVRPIKLKDSVLKNKTETQWNLCKLYKKKNGGRNNTPTTRRREEVHIPQSDMRILSYGQETTNTNRTAKRARSPNTKQPQSATKSIDGKFNPPILFFRPTPSWLPPGRYTRSIAAKRWIVIIMQGFLLVDSHKSTGSGPVRSPVSCPIKKKQSTNQKQKQPSRQSTHNHNQTKPNKKHREVGSLPAMR